MFRKIVSRAKRFFAGSSAGMGEWSAGMHPDAPVLILSTFPEELRAEEVIRLLLAEGVIACGSLLPGVRSMYLWKGSVEESREVQVVLKTTSGVRDRCMERLAALHPYEVPEIVAVDPSAVAGPYAAWVGDALRCPGIGNASGSENL